MRYVIIRDDDTNALTPPHCLERLYRPFLDRGWPVNLATIPEVDVRTRMADGTPEGYLTHFNGATSEKVAIGSNSALLDYLRANSGYRIVQHGCNHEQLEFDCPDRIEAAARIDRGTRMMLEAGLPRPTTFVAPYDRLSRESMREAAGRFRVVSTGWFELCRLPYFWWPGFVMKKIRMTDHWRVGRTWLLSHPGCFLSCHRPNNKVLEAIIHWVDAHPLTVLVTHWWEYFRDGKSDDPFIDTLHETADYLSRQSDIRVVSFDDVPELPINGASTSKTPW